jgi:hypothetical protein
MKPPLPRRGKRAGLAAALALVLAGGTAAADRPVVYRWIDESGIQHFTTQPDRIPSEFRDSVREIGTPGSEAALPPAATTAAPSPAAKSAPAAVSPPPAQAPVPPAVAAPPPGPRVTPEGEFEEAPLGSGRSAAPSRSSTVSAPATAPERDVAAPPPGYHRETPGSESSAAPPPSEPAPAVSAGTTTGAPPGGSAPTSISSGVESETAPPGDVTGLDDRIVALEEQVGRDQTALQNILSQPREADGPRIADREDFREIAKRLPKLQADLKTLREQRNRQSGP